MASARSAQPAPAGLQVQGDIAFLPAAAPARIIETGNFLQPAGLIALGSEDWVQEGEHRKAPRLQLGHDRVDQERHVVVGNFQHGMGEALPPLVAGAARKRILWRPFGLLGNELESFTRIARQPFGPASSRPSAPLRP